MERRRQRRLCEFVRDATDGFLARPAVSFLGAAVPVGNDVVHVADKDRVVSEIEQTCLFAQDTFGPLALGVLQPQLLVAPTEIGRSLFDFAFQLVARLAKFILTLAQSILGAFARSAP